MIRKYAALSITCLLLLGNLQLAGVAEASPGRTTVRAQRASQAGPQARIKRHQQPANRARIKTSLRIQTRSTTPLGKVEARIESSATSAFTGPAPIPTARQPGKLARRGKQIKERTNAALARIRHQPTIDRLFRTYSRVSASLTRRFDRWQSRAPPWVAKPIELIRTYTLPSVAAFSVLRLKSDPRFLGGYLVANSIFSYVLLPGAVGFGADPALAVVLNALTNPLMIGVIIFRERSLRRAAGEESTLSQSAGSVVREYRDFARERRQNASTRAKTLATE